MEPRSTYTDIVQGYVTLASDLLDRWSTHSSKVATRLDHPPYNADKAVADLAATASLATETGFLLASEALDAVAICTGRQCERHMVDSDIFFSPVPGATLQLAGPLLNADGSDELPVSVITITPSALGPSQTEFLLCADATGHEGATYAGKVVASHPGTADQPVTVWITVP